MPVACCAISADAVNTSDGSEHQGRVLGLADGGWIVMFADSGNDGSGEGLYARRYDASGALVGGTSADGTASAGSWRVNLQTVHDQYMKYQGMAQLADGGFVITFTSNHSDQSGLAVWAQVYNADGTLAGKQTSRATLELGYDGNTYTTSGMGQVLDLNGNVIQVNCNTATATRFR